MELVGAMSSREWNSLGGIFSSNNQDSNHDDHQFMAGHNFLANYSAVPNHHHLGTIGASSLEFPFPICTYEGDETYSYGAYSDDHQPVQDNIIAMRNTDLYINNINGDHDDHCDHHQCSNQDMVSNEQRPAEGTESLPGSSKKRSRNSHTTNSTNYDQVQKSKRNVRPRKSKKFASSDEEEDGNASKKLLFSPNSSSSTAEENSNAFPEELGGMASSSSPKGSSTALNLNGKARASRGSATDPQSVYARKRREKINERLRILQNLVPNGTKVDISTMLEEAVQYVKFLQLQIKLLSSDDLWMYAPLAYNGMNVGIDLSLAVPRQH